MSDSGHVAAMRPPIVRRASDFMLTTDRHPVRLRTADSSKLELIRLTFQTMRIFGATARTVCSIDSAL